MKTIQIVRRRSVTSFSMVDAMLQVKVCLGTRILYNTMVMVKLCEPVATLKKKICEKLSCLSDLQEPRVVAVFKGKVMQDGRTLRDYGVARGNTVYVFKIIQTEITSPGKQVTKTDWDNLVSATLSFKVNPAFQKSMMNLTSPDEIFNIILNVPDLNDDLVSIALLPLSELLAILMDTNVLLPLTHRHPALALSVLHLATSALKGLLHSGQQEEHFKDFMDLYSSWLTSETSNPSESEDSSSETVAQLSSALGRISIHQPQPSTSDAPVRLMDNEEILTALHMMKEMDLSNENLNHYALQKTNDLGSAVELILNGFSIDDY